jgi:hypothetical protein
MVARARAVVPSIDCGIPKQGSQPVAQPWLRGAFLSVAAGYRTAGPGMPSVTIKLARHARKPSRG